MGRKLEIELPDPDPPTLDLSVHPEVAAIRERLARLEERTTSEGVDPAAAEALRLAGETRTAVDAVANRVTELEKRASGAAPVVDVHPPAAVPVPPPADPDPSTEHSTTETHDDLPIFHPSRWF